MAYGSVDFFGEKETQTASGEKLEVIQQILPVTILSFKVEKFENCQNFEYSQHWAIVNLLTVLEEQILKLLPQRNLKSFNHFLLS